MKIYMICDIGIDVSYIHICHLYVYISQTYHVYDIYGRYIYIWEEGTYILLAHIPIRYIYLSVIYL